MAAQLRAVIYILVGALTGLFMWAWECKFPKSSYLVVYFGRPLALVDYFASSASELILPTIFCFLVALGCLLLSGLLAAALITIGLYSNRALTRIESAAAFSQTVPVLVVVAIFLMIEREATRILGVRPPADWFCVLPVTLGLMFPPLINGAAAVLRMPIQVRAILRLWNAPAWWRIRRVYLPYAIPDILAGVRASATWAVGSTLIAEGMVNGVSGSNNTLGYLLLRPFSNGSKTTAVIIISTFLGYAVYRISGVIHHIIQKRLLGEIDLNEAAYPLQSAASSHKEKAYAAST